MGSNPSLTLGFPATRTQARANAGVHEIAQIVHSFTEVGYFRVHKRYVVGRMGRI